jgi:hypothetical protein
MPQLFSALGAVAAIVPFGFAMIRAVETEGRDLRYLWVAFAAFVGALARMALAARSGGRRMTRGTLAAGVFFMSTLFAVLAAWLLGTAVGPAMFIVGAGFGFCFALSTFLRMPAR